MNAVDAARRMLDFYLRLDAASVAFIGDPAGVEEMRDQLGALEADLTAAIAADPVRFAACNAVLDSIAVAASRLQRPDPLAARAHAPIEASALAVRQTLDAMRQAAAKEASEQEGRI